MNDLGRTGKVLIFGACATILVVNAPPIITEPVKVAVSQMRTQYTDVPAYAPLAPVAEKANSDVRSEVGPATSDSGFVGRLKSLLK